MGLETDPRAMNSTEFHQLNLEVLEQDENVGVVVQWLETPPSDRPSLVRNSAWVLPTVRSEERHIALLIL